MANLIEENSLDMHFVAKKDEQQELWLVIDIPNGNAIVGVHELETLAFLDASKREQDTYNMNATIHRMNGSKTMTTLKAFGVAFSLTLISLAMMPEGSFFTGSF